MTRRTRAHDPPGRCSTDIQGCRLLRTCAGCGRVFTKTRYRIHHEHKCRVPADLLITEQQHWHLIEVHRRAR